jgi:hypothetical protein
MKMLSILMPTTPERAEMFSYLYENVLSQVDYCHSTHESLGQVEVLVDDSKRFLDGGLSIGKKREKLLMMSEGKYVCFLDSDDDISPDYVETLLRLCQDDSDVCSFSSFAKLSNYWMLVDMSIKNESNEESKPGIIYRRPWHICPVKSQIAKQINFEDVNYSEDWLWMEKVLEGCITESKTDKILHIYDHGSHSEADKITEHEKL